MGVIILLVILAGQALPDPNRFDALTDARPVLEPAAANISLLPPWRLADDVNGRMPPTCRELRPPQR
jgi:hypothetical protein